MGDFAVSNDVGEPNVDPYPLKSLSGCLSPVNGMSHMGGIGDDV